LSKGLDVGTQGRGTTAPLVELRKTIQERLIQVARADPRLVGVIDYGATDHG
jgi:hypothetical protein